jgi:biopolymer transport protein ExbD
LSKSALQAQIRTLASADTGQTLMLQAHHRVPVQEVVDVMQWSREAGLKMVLATDPR